MSNCLIDYLKALLTPIIAVLAVYIAYRQWITARNQFRLNYFDRRLSIFTAVMEFVSGIDITGTIPQEKARAFLMKTREARFLFADDIDAYCTELYNKSEQLIIKKEVFKDQNPQTSERERMINEIVELKTWFHNQIPNISQRFEKYLGSCRDSMGEKKHSMRLDFSVDLVMCIKYRNSRD